MSYFHAIIANDLSKPSNLTSSDQLIEWGQKQNIESNYFNSEFYNFQLFKGLYNDHEIPRRVVTRKPQRKKCYALTLTTELSGTTTLNEALNKILDSKIFDIKKYTIGRELTQKGIPHYHLYIENVKPIYASDIQKLTKTRFEIKLLKTSLDQIKWKQYCQKKKTEKEIDYYDQLQLLTIEDIDLTE